MVDNVSCRNQSRATAPNAPERGAGELQSPEYGERETKYGGENHVALLVSVCEYFLCVQPCAGQAAHVLWFPENVIKMNLKIKTVNINNSFCRLTHLRRVASSMDSSTTTLWTVCFQ